MTGLNNNIAILPNPPSISNVQNTSPLISSPKSSKNSTPEPRNKKKNFPYHDDFDEYGNRPNGQLSTSSPAGIAAASAVTPDKLARLLLTQGPLAIRHLTSHLANQIPGFAQLSLSKQRRLIIAALDSGDLVTGCVFEKVGWGQWAARHVGAEFVKARQAEINKAQSMEKNEEKFEKKKPLADGVDASKNANKDASKNSNKDTSIGAVKKSSSASSASSNKSRSPSLRKPSDSFGWKNRRESITNAANDPHTDVIPRSPRLSFRRGSAGLTGPTKLIHSINDEDAILSSSDEENYHSEEEDDDDDNDDEGEIEAGLNNKFQYHEIKPFSTIKPRSHSQASGVPLLTAAANGSTRTHRSSFNSGKGISKPKVRSRLGSFNGAIAPSVAPGVTSITPRGSFSGTSALADSFEPVESLTEDFSKYRRRQSFNESFMRKSSSSPKRMSISSITNATNTPILSNASVVANANINRNSNSTSPSYHSDTDEEDWASMGAASLRHDAATLSRPLISDNEVKIKKKNLDFREEAAVYGLVNLSSI